MVTAHGLGLLQLGVERRDLLHAVFFHAKGDSAARDRLVEQVELGPSSSLRASRAVQALEARESPG